MHTEVEDKKANENKADSPKTAYEYKDGFRAENGKYISQLSVYYQKANEKSEKDGKTRIIIGRILAPNYNMFDDKELEKYLYGSKYKCLSYKEIHRFFNDNRQLVNKDKYIEDFINAMQKHTTETDNEHRNELLQRLKYRIDNS